jgi:hypothetical protein
MRYPIALAAAGFALTSLAHATPPEGFVSICTLDESCAVEASTLVAFGQQDRFSFRTLSGSFICNGKTFGIEGKISPSATCMTLDSNLQGTAASSSSSGATMPEDTLLNIPSGTYAIVSRSSGKALAIRAGSEQDGALLVQQDFRGEPHQLWRVEDLKDGFYSISASHSGKSLDILDINNRDGAKLQQLPWMNSWDQHWNIQALGGGFYRIASRYSHQSLDVYEMNHHDDGPICLWTFWGGENQQWRLIPVSATTQNPSQSTTP